MQRLYEGPCGDPTCYRGAEGWSGGGGAIVYKDGPCQASDCKWPWQILDFAGEWITVSEEQAKISKYMGSAVRLLPAKPHFTDNPTPPIVDAGKEARAWLQSKKASRSLPPSGGNT